MKTVHKTGTASSVDAYRPGNLYKHEGDWHVVADHKQRQNDQGGYEHTLTLCDPLTLPSSVRAKSRTFTPRWPH